MKPWSRLAIAFLFAASWTTQALAAELVARVVAIHDGDTLTVLLEQKQVRIRLIDIDAPELKQPFGQQSRKALASLCARQTATVLSYGQDRYGRTLGRVTCSGINANADQVRRGMAWVFERYAPKDSPLYAIQRQAQASKLGLWVDPRPIAPWDWRIKRTYR